MLRNLENQVVLWVSKEKPPYIVGANFETTASGKEVASKWQESYYRLVLVDTGLLSDGFSGFDVVRSVRAIDSRAVVYLMSPSPTAPENAWAQRLGAKSVIRKSTVDLTNTLRDNQAIDMSAKPGQPTKPSITQRIMGFVRHGDAPAPAATKPAQRVQTVQAKTPPPSVLQNKPTTVVDKKSEAPAPTAMVTKVVTQTTNDNNDTQDTGSNRLDDDRFQMPAVATTQRTKTSDFRSSNSHELNLTDFYTIIGDGAEEEIQFAWELYTELATRTAVTGKPNDPTCTKTDGELYSESMASLMAFCKELRTLMRTFPAHKASIYASSYPVEERHLGNIMLEVTCVVLNPFLDKWRQSYLSWWEYHSDRSLPAEERQTKYPQLQAMLVDWRHLKKTMRSIQDIIERKYQLK